MYVWIRVHVWAVWITNGPWIHCHVMTAMPPQTATVLGPFEGPCFGRRLAVEGFVGIQPTIWSLSKLGGGTGSWDEQTAAGGRFGSCLSKRFVGNLCTEYKCICAFFCSSLRFCTNTWKRSYIVQSRFSGSAPLWKLQPTTSADDEGRNFESMK